ncbi:RND family efflux transporter, MFP subunit [Arboricoccus pini]|uniref:RND family efflux transporter, MFP subunit n=1 Tax=Arboricoccus pini TaxID=1963835 RepID=A0A212S040_9PROT|nr:efflux RND transporter periplasmic adaptor subunit [Arboricoccus pini]SNB78313.1 RND family efflux transporter, MFP subunit [Arboricoccus pini]
MKVLATLLVRLLVTICVVAVAVLVGWQLWVYYMEDPWTRDGRVRADVVQIAPDVSGLVTSVAVVDNQIVQKGQALFTIDQARFELALREANATVEAKEATMEQARRDASRYQRLDTNAVSQSSREQAESQYLTAKADYDQAVADRDTAKLNLDRTVVTAPVNGIVTNFGLRPGTYVSAGRGVFAVIDRDSYYVNGYFEETKLERINIGDPVSIHLMGSSVDMRGRVESIASGIVDRERSDSADLLADVNPTFSWVRLAQRIPVRVRLEDVPPEVKLVAGRTVTVTVLENEAPRGQTAVPGPAPRN